MIYLLMKSLKLTGKGIENYEEWQKSQQSLVNSQQLINLHLHRGRTGTCFYFTQRPQKSLQNTQRIDLQKVFGVLYDLTFAFFA
jgi:hypothetical protein